MSILIKGATLPYSCTECPLVIKEQISEHIDKNSVKVSPIYNCIYKPEDIEDGWIKFSKADKERQDWCPIVEIPEHHGDLIDRNYLIKESLAEGAYGYVDTKEIYDAPTIVETE